MSRVTPAELAELAEKHEIQLVDVRRHDEWDEGHIEGAVHLPLETLTAAADMLATDRPIVFYCKVGERSKMAADAFAASGFDAMDLEGGINAWKDAGKPVTTPGK
ncbi:MAG: rhodanese-like domain-containing protein [Thermoleophilaceae bacterium]|nr:rhodanese-like domain-containing protein [Thermoleophilaceae bacterium]